MSHISEGLLHAHLDGAVGHDRAEEWLLAEAHLSVCEDCRRRLDEARQLRDAAGEILAVASAPAVRRPDFEELVAQAAGGPKARPRSAWWHSTSHLAWAASLMLAVGAGWLGRELLIQTGQNVPAVVVESKAIPQTPEQTAVLKDALGADESAVAEASARVEAEEVDRVSGERAAKRIAVAPANEAEVVMMEKSEGRQKAAEEFRQDAVSKDAKVDRLEAAIDEAEGEPERDAVVRMAGAVAVSSTCYAADGPIDLQGGLLAADQAVTEEDQKNAPPAAPSELRLSADGTAVAGAGGRQMVGTWVEVSGDSVQVLLAGAGVGLEMRFERMEDGLSGTVARSGRGGEGIRVEGDALESVLEFWLSKVACDEAP
ncbi:MAG: hypothetical protein V3S56_07285 [Gemmatimonadota bacterium]